MFSLKKDFLKLVITIFLVVSFVFGVSNSVFSVSSEITSEEAGQLIEILIAAGVIPQEKISSARAIALSLKGQTNSASGIFTKDLSLGSSDKEVLILQRILNRDSATRVATSGNGSTGKETDYFGPATQVAVIKFQQKYGITPANGLVGPKTRQKLNEVSILVGTNQQNEGRTYNTAGSYPFVDLRVGALSSSYVNVTKNSPFTLIWTSRNVDKCFAGSNSKPTTGTQTINGISSQTTYSITCNGSQGTTTDVVVVGIVTDAVVTNPNSNQNNQYAQNNQNSITPPRYSSNSYYNNNANDSFGQNNNPLSYNTSPASSTSFNYNYNYSLDQEDLDNLNLYQVASTSCTAPCIDLKVNGKDTSIYTSSAKDKYKYTLSWLGQGIKNCRLQATSTDSQFNAKDYYATSSTDLNYVSSYYLESLNPTKEVYKMSFPGFIYGESVAVSGSKAIKLPTPKNLTFTVSCDSTTSSKKITDSVQVSFASTLLPKVDLKLDGMDRLTQTYNEKYVNNRAPGDFIGRPRPYNATWSSSGVTECIADNVIQFYSSPETKVIPGWNNDTKVVNGNETAVLNGDPDISRITLRLTCNDGYLSDRNSTTTGVYKGLIDYVVSPYSETIREKICPMDGLYEQGKDLIDPTKITWPAEASDVGSWSITGYLQNVTVSGGTVNYPHDKANVWPAVPVPGVGKTAAGVYGNAWAIIPMGAMNSDGTYNSYSAQFTGWMNPGQTTKSTDELQGPGKVASVNCGSAGSVCDNNGVTMTVPNYYGFMVSTLAKGGYRSPSNERTNIVISGCTNVDFEQLLNEGLSGGIGSTYNAFGNSGSSGSIGFGGIDGFDFNQSGAIQGGMDGAMIGAGLGTLVMPGIGTYGGALLGGTVGGLMGGFDLGGLGDLGGGFGW